MNYKKTKLSLISNTIFLSVSILLLTFVWINFYTRNLSISLFLGLIFSIIFTILYIIITNKKLEKEVILKNNKINYELIKNHFLLSNYPDLTKLLFKIYNIKLTNYISNNHFTSDNSDIFLIFENELLDNTLFIKLLKERINNKVVIFCFDYKVDLEIENINIEYININNIINKINEKKIEIENLIKVKAKPKISFKLILNVALNKERSKNYFIFGLFITFSSLFSPFTIYYILSGTILILLSIYSRFNRKFNN